MAEQRYQVPRLNGEPVDNAGYARFHETRMQMTMEKLRELGARRIVEVGGHPWLMTAYIIDRPEMAVCATISAEEVACWPDDIGVTPRQYTLETAQGNRATFTNYSANVERTRFAIAEEADTVIACEIMEHFIRSPHIFLLNANAWLPVGGKLLITTPNGLHFANPLRQKSPTPAYRYHTYERHAFLYSRADLVDLVALCGFSIVEAGYWAPYPGQRRGPRVVYRWLSRLPGRFWQDKFMNTVYVVAEKRCDAARLPRAPRVYDARGPWEYIAAPADNHD